MRHSIRIVTTGVSTGRTRRRLAFATLFALTAVFLTLSPLGEAANQSADLDQCANGTFAAPDPTACQSGNEWVNGNVNESKAHYFEGDSLPYRLKLNNLAAGSVGHTVVIEWDTTKASKHAIDYLTTYNRTVTTADPCAGVTACGSPSTFAIPADPQVTGAGVTPIAGNFTIFGGTITSASAYSYPNGTGFVGDKSARITLTFTASVSNPVIAWAGHVATRANWGNGGSAVAISGSPYHTRLIDLDGSGGNQDRSLSRGCSHLPRLADGCEGSDARRLDVVPVHGLAGAAGELLAGGRRHGGEHQALRQHHDLPELHRR